ncbi:hypothetical protein Tco_1217602 [Tanacetum coccineum]
MSTPKFAETHNLVAFLEKPEESNRFEEIIDFLNTNSIQYALMVNLTIYTTCIEQFWISAKAKTVNEERQIQALVDKKKVIMSETSIRSDLKLNDAEGTNCLPTATIFAELERMGVFKKIETRIVEENYMFLRFGFSSNEQTVKKTPNIAGIGNGTLIGLFDIDVLLHIYDIIKPVFARKSIMLLCLANIVIKVLMKNDSLMDVIDESKFGTLIWKRLSILLIDEEGLVLQKADVPSYPKVSHLHANSVMLELVLTGNSTTGEYVGAANCYGQYNSPTQPSPTQPSTRAEHHFPTPHDSPLHAVHSHGSDEGSLKLNELTNLVTKLSERIGVLEDDLRKTKKTYSSAFTKLILRVKKLEARVKIGKARKRAKVVLSEDDEDVEDDSSKQGRKLSDAEVQEKASTKTEPIIQEVTPTEVIQDQESSEKGSAEVSTAGATKGTASKVLVVSTAEENISTAGRTVTYRRRSEEKRTRKDKGKAIMTESEPKKKSKKEIEQERLSFAEAIRLEEQMNEEQRAQIARDEEIARQWDEEERQRAMSEAKSTKKIDWNDPSVIRYHALKMKPKTIAQARRNMIKYLKNQGNYKISDFKGMSYNEIRPIFEKVWDFNQHIEPMEHGSEKMKSPEKIEEEDADTQKEMKEVVKESGAKRKKSLPRKRRTVKRQKLEEDAEKEELKGFLDIIPREVVPIEVESLSTKFPIVDWKILGLTVNFMWYYHIFCGEGVPRSIRFELRCLEDFDRQDVEELYRLVKERYSASRPEGYDLMLWGDLHTLFEPDKEDELWKNQHEYNVIS